MDKNFLTLSLQNLIENSKHNLSSLSGSERPCDFYCLSQSVILKKKCGNCVLAYLEALIKSLSPSLNTSNTTSLFLLLLFKNLSS